jgi:hypothetical protein
MRAKNLRLTRFWLQPLVKLGLKDGVSKQLTNTCIDKSLKIKTVYWSFENISSGFFWINVWPLGQIGLKHSTRDIGDGLSDCNFSICAAAKVGHSEFCLHFVSTACA